MLLVAKTAVAAALLLASAAYAQPIGAAAPATGPATSGVPGAPATGPSDLAPPPTASPTAPPAPAGTPPSSPPTPGTPEPLPAPVLPPASSDAPAPTSTPAPAYPVPAPVYPAEPAPAYPAAPDYAPPPGYVPPPGAYPAYGYPPPYAMPGAAPYPSPQPVEIVPETPWQPPRGYHEHDGFFLHMGIGAGYAYTKSQAGASISGGSMTMSFDLGVAVAHNLVLHAGAGITGTLSSRIESGGVVRSDTMDTKERELNFYSGFVGATYYMTAHNLFASLRGGLGQYVLGNSNADNEYSSNTAWLVRGGLGKEWWVGPNWGIGVEGIACYSRVGSDRVGGLRALGGPMFGLAAVATYQ